jgi:hypothetical protein
MDNLTHCIKQFISFLENPMKEDNNSVSYVKGLIQFTIEVQFLDF